MSNKLVLGQPQANALGSFSPPRWDLVGPTVADDIYRAIQRYGADEVQRAVKEATKKKRGRKREPDWINLKDVIEEDARKWLEGRDPIAERSHYSIAKEYAAHNPGHDEGSTRKRIERKLARGMHNRLWYILWSAEEQTRENYSYLEHIRAIKAIRDLTDPKLGQLMIDRTLRTVTDYEAREGGLPPEHMTFADVEAAVKRASQNALASLVPPRGVFGNGPASGQVDGLLASILKGAGMYGAQ